MNSEVKDVGIERPRLFMSNVVEVVIDCDDVSWVTREVLFPRKQFLSSDQESVLKCILIVVDILSRGVNKLVEGKIFCQCKA